MFKSKSLSNREKRFLSIQGVISLALLLIGILMLKPTGGKPDKEELEAYTLMRRSIEAISDHHPSGLIGPEWSEITTTTGDPEAKRTTVNPNFAAVVVRLLREAGVRRGDTVALNCSGSFPALMIASVSAAQSLGLGIRTILSVGSSSFGASNPDFTVVDQYLFLQQKGLFLNDLIAWSFGGELDTGSGFDPAVAAGVKTRLEKAGLLRLEDESLESIVKRRLELYEAGHPGSLSAFINTGGSLAGMGSSPLILKVKPGLVRKADLPARPQQGLVFRMLEEGVPVIHLLHIKGLTRNYGLPWDPATMPPFAGRQAGTPWVILLLAALALVQFFLVLASYRMLQNRG